MGGQTLMRALEIIVGQEEVLEQVEEGGAPIEGREVAPNSAEARIPPELGEAGCQLIRGLRYQVVNQGGVGTREGQQEGH